MNKKKIERLKEVAPSLWSSYQHMYDVRRTGIQNRANILLIIISFLSAISISLFVKFENSYFLVSFLLQMISFIILLKVFFIKELKVHWFESDSFLKNLDKNEFYQDLFADLKALEGETYVFMTELGNITKRSLIIILVSLYLLLLGLIVLYLHGSNLYLGVLGIIASIFTVYFYYKRQPKFNYDEDYKKYRKQVDNWVKNG